MVSSILLDTSNYDSTDFLVFSSSLELALFFQRKTFCWDRTRDSLWNSGRPIQSPLLLAVSCSAISYQRMADKLYVIDAPSLRFFILTFEEENLIYSDFNLETLQRTNERMFGIENERIWRRSFLFQTFDQIFHFTYLGVSWHRPLLLPSV